jgi:signal transduction histidine kinase/CheY-like chemotaxis protein
LACLALLQARGESLLQQPPKLQGFPPTRHYSFEDIGPVSPGLTLACDPFGRITATREGTHLAFDDNTWTDLLSSGDLHRNITRSSLGPDGIVYTGAVGDWGRLEYASSDSAHVVSFRPENCPGWTVNNGFTSIFHLRLGVLFAGGSGAVFRWNTGEQSFIEAPSTVSAFFIGDKVFISTNFEALITLDTATHEQNRTLFKECEINVSTPWDAGHVLTVVNNKSFALFDGKTFTPWPSEIDSFVSAGVIAMKRLDGNRVAVAINGHGLQFLDEKGRLLLSLLGSNYEGIIDLFQNEQGILWVSSGDGLTKVFYDAPTSEFDNRQGLSMYWPSLLTLKDKTFILSNGTLYAPMRQTLGELTRFEAVPLGIPKGVWHSATTSHGVLFPSVHGVYWWNEEGKVSEVFSDFHVHKLWLTDDSGDSCLLIGEDRIGLLRWNGSTWVEGAQSIKGLGYPSLIESTAPNSLWVELGINRVGHITLRKGVLHAETLAPFKEALNAWASLGAVGHYIVISRGEPNRVYFNEDTDSFCEPPPLEELLNRTPYRTIRPKMDSDGVIWCPYTRGIYRLLPGKEGYTADFMTFRNIQDSYPQLRIYNGNDIWIRTEKRLLHLDSSRVSPRVTFRPTLLSVSDSRNGSELWTMLGHEEKLLRIPYGSNSLNFHIFPGTFSFLRSPGYQFKLDGYNDQWSALSHNTTISLTSLHEGDYVMHVRFVGEGGELCEPLVFPFVVLPPFYRTWYAYAGYALLLAASGLAAGRLLLRRARRRTGELELLVSARTQELDKTNSQLRQSVVEAKQATEAKGRFLANMSHEIRTPMNGVIGLSDLLLESELTKPQRELATIIRDSSQSLLSIINDILDFSKMEAGKLVLKTGSFSLTDCVEEALECLSLQASEKNLALASLIDHELPRRLIGDEGRLRQVLVNLLSNAVKFTEKGSVTLVVRKPRQTAADGGGRCPIHFEVTDTGIGIPQDKIGQLFQAFIQADNSMSRRFGGTGLGLAISRQIVEQMGGHVQVESTVGKGSVFSFDVILKIDPDGAKEARLFSLPKGLRLLCIHQGDIHLSVLRHHAAFWELRLEDCSEPERAAELIGKAAQAGDPYLGVIVDFEQALGEGLTFISKLEAKLGASLPPVIMLCPLLQHVGMHLDPARSAIKQLLARPIREQALGEALERLCSGTPNASGVPASPTLEEAHALTGLKILVVEDMPINQLVIQKLLDRLGQSAEFANDGLEALTKMQEGSFNLVYMDLQMPQMDGLEVTRQLRKNPRFAKTEIVAMTANAMEGDRAKCLKAGMTDYLSKPINLKDLNAALLRSARRLRESGALGGQAGS